jgi:hypothetical protein
MILVAIYRKSNWKSRGSPFGFLWRPAIYPSVFLSRACGVACKIIKQETRMPGRSEKSYVHLNPGRFRERLSAAAVRVQESGARSASAVIRVIRCVFRGATYALGPVTKRHAVMSGGDVAYGRSSELKASLPHRLEVYVSRHVVVNASYVHGYVFAKDVLPNASSSWRCCRPSDVLARN